MGKSRDSAHQSSPPRSDPGSAFDETMDGVSPTAALPGDSTTSQTVDSSTPTPSKVSLGAAAQEGGARSSSPMIEDSLLSATVDIPGPFKSQPPKGNSGERTGAGSLPRAAAVYLARCYRLAPKTRTAPIPPLKWSFPSQTGTDTSS